MFRILVEKPPFTLLMQGKINYAFQAKLWKYDGPAGWYFVSLPEAISKEIRENLQWMEEGWGRMKSTAQIEDYQWETSIWYDTKKSTYILPIKAAIRTKFNLHTNQTIDLQIGI